MAFFVCRIVATAVALGTLLLAGCGHPSPPYPSGTVHLEYDDNEGYRLIRNGEAVFVKGGAGGENLSLLKAAGGNTVRVYSPDSLPSVLDEAAALGLYVVADLPLPVNYYEVGPLAGWGDSLGAVERVLEIVARHKDHPALLYWMLGNEIFNDAYSMSFARAYNELADTVRKLDPNHPISTAVNQHQLKEMQTGLVKIDVDFVSLNYFGNIHEFTTAKALLYPFWRGPYLFSEWGFSGPWEEDETAWRAPLEPSNHTKASELERRYREYIAPLDDGRCLGHLAFYWGHKFERTSTWFNVFSPFGEPMEQYHRLAKIWSGDTSAYVGPSIDSLLLDGQQANQSVVVATGETVEARVYFTSQSTGNTVFTWDVRREHWREYEAGARTPISLPHALTAPSPGTARLQVPDLPGAYRLYLSLRDQSGFAATANVPFYVISSQTHAR